MVPRAGPQTHPVFSRFVDDEDIAIQSKQVFRRRIVGRMASRHLVRLSLGDNDYNAGSGASTPLATGQALFFAVDMGVAELPSRRPVTCFTANGPRMRTLAARGFVSLRSEVGETAAWQPGIFDKSVASG